MRFALNNLDPLWPWIITVTSAATGLVVWTGIFPALRPVLVFFFLLVCPGMAYIQLLSIQDPLIKAVLAIALSLAIDTVIAMILLSTRGWVPFQGMLLIIGICMLGVILQMNRNRPEEDGQEFAEE